MGLLPEHPDSWDYFSLIMAVVAGCAWGWVMADCWIAHLKDTKKRKEG